MIIETSMLIISNDQKSFVPLRTGSQSLINLLHKFLPIAQIMSRVIIISRKMLEIKVARLYDCQIWQLAIFGMMLELEVVVMKLGNVLKLPQISVKQCSWDVLVVDPK
eukprot:Gb_00797 [translate_table: standard]